MIVLFRKYLVIIAVLTGCSAMAQTNTVSPYSQFGIGELRGDQLPQYRAMGGISTGVRYLGVYHYINVENPASYGSIRLTSIDVGAFGNFTRLNKNSLSENSASFSLSHINFALPIAGRSALSFGLMPYSELGFRYAQPGTIDNDTTRISYVYSGEGGTSKAYLGYGVQLGKHFSIGANVNYIFGQLNNIRSTEYPNQVEAYNIVNENISDVHGLTYNYGLQFFSKISDKLNITVGYSGEAGTRLNSRTRNVVTRTASSVADDGENLALDTVDFVQGPRRHLSMPMKHRIGVSLNNNKWLVGADAHFARWSDFRAEGINPGLSDSYGLAVGGQYTPNMASLSYFAMIDYRLGLKYDKTYIHINNQDINQAALTFGAGFPLLSKMSTAFYKINFSAELGQRGTLANSLVKERYVNIHLGFTLNDRWFQRYRYD